MVGEGTTRGRRAANIIINQRGCDVNVKLPEPIWSCITRGGWKETSWRAATRVEDGSGGGPMGHCESYLSCCLYIYTDPRKKGGIRRSARGVRSYWPIIDGYCLY